MTYLFYVMSICVFPACMCKGIGSPGAGVTDGYELPCECWELDLGPLEDQLLLLTVELSLQPLN